MARRCTLCDHPEREAIDRALVDGASNRAIASRFRVNRAAVQRHSTRHLPKHLANAAEAERVSDAGALLERVQRLLSKAERALERAEAAKDDRLGAVWFRELRSTVELLGRVSHELTGDTSVSVQLGIFQRLGVKDENEASRKLSEVKEYESLPEPELARRMAAWLGRYVLAHPHERSALLEFVKGSAQVIVERSGTNGGMRP